MSVWDDMVAGRLYDAGDPDLVARRKRAQELMSAYNATTYHDSALRRLLKEELFSGSADNAIRSPVYVDYGTNVVLGRRVFMNYGCVLLDVCPIVIGDDCDIGPYVQILTADHPRDPETRESGLEFGRPVTLGRNVWIGGGAIVLPGVTVGDHAVIGAGAVVTRDVEPGATVAGNPARPLVSHRPRD
jgi:maltose O-acetyltransferase